MNGAIGFLVFFGAWVACIPIWLAFEWFYKRRR
jgi:hypothetical protein